MGKRELGAKYGSSKNTNQLINAAIRVECPGGNELLDLTDWLHKHPRMVDGREGQELLGLVRAIVDAMAAEIRRRYDMPPRDD
jgi:hypothetical protein